MSVVIVIRLVSKTRLHFGPFPLQYDVDMISDNANVMHITKCSVQFYESSGRGSRLSREFCTVQVLLELGSPADFLMLCSLSRT